MKVTAIIPSLANEQTRPHLKLCVESLRATTDWDIIVVTNGQRAPIPMPEIFGITKRLSIRDQGQAQAVNIGASTAEPNTDYLFIVNDDMYFAPNWKDNLRFDFPVFSPNLLEPENNHGSAAPFKKFDGGFTLDEFQQEAVNEEVKRLVELQEPPETGLNFPLFVRRDVWNTVGGYDVAYDPWGSNSDTDLQAKFHLAGIQTMRVRDVIVYHFSNKSDTFTDDKQAFWQHNWDYFTQKWGFNRDTVPGCDVWYSKNILPEDRSTITYKPKWENYYYGN